MGKIKDFFVNACKKSKGYFTYYRADITRNNYIILRKVTVIYVVLLALYAIVSTFMFHNFTLLYCYLVFLALTVGFILTARICYRKYRRSYRVMQALCMLFIVLVMAFITTISVFPYPDRPSIFFPVLYLVMTVLFIFPLWETNLLLSGIQAVFLVLVLTLKTPESYAYDIFASVTAWVIGFAFTYLVLDLRLREGDVRRELERISFTDEMTGLANRRDFNRHITRTYTECRKKKQPIALFMMDIDKFKDYNDCLGHIAGDACLSMLGQAMLDAFEEEDVSMFRYGGEEFCLILKGKQVKRVKLITEKIMDCVRQCAIERPDSAEGYVTVSIGVALDLCPQRDSYIDLLKRADAALYYAKENGRNRVAFYQSEMRIK